MKSCNVFLIVAIACFALTFASVVISYRCTFVGNPKRLIRYSPGGFATPSIAEFDDGTIIEDPHFEGGIVLGASYRQKICYNIYGVEVKTVWVRFDESNETTLVGGVCLEGPSCKV